MLVYLRSCLGGFEHVYTLKNAIPGYGKCKAASVTASKGQARINGTSRAVLNPLSNKG